MPVVSSISPVLICFCQLYNQIVALFKSSICNTPESITSGYMTAERRIKYQLSVFGGLSVLVIEMKRAYGTVRERYDAIGQVIAECTGVHLLLTTLIGSNSYILACDCANHHFKLPSFPIFGILCIGSLAESTFDFFSFDGRTSPPTISRGAFHTPDSNPPETYIATLEVPDYSATSKINFIRSLRPICEVLYYILLRAYKTGIRVNLNMQNAIDNNKETMPSWNKAHLLATKALTHAKDGGTKAAAHDSAANEEAGLALECLQQRFLQISAFVISHHRTDSSF
jgi:hypothetical protein